MKATESFSRAGVGALWGEAQSLDYVPETMSTIVPMQYDINNVVPKYLVEVYDSQSDAGHVQPVRALPSLRSHCSMPEAYAFENGPWSCVAVFSWWRPTTSGAPQLGVWTQGRCPVPPNQSPYRTK